MQVKSGKCTREINKKAFQLKSNCPLGDSPGYKVNKFEHVGGGGGPCKVRSKLNKFGHVWRRGHGLGWGPCMVKFKWNNFRHVQLGGGTGAEGGPVW